MEVNMTILAVICFTITALVVVAFAMAIINGDD